MATPNWSGYAHVALAAGLLLVSILSWALSRRGWLAPVGILFLIAFHPAWAIEPGHERDFSKRQARTAASVLAGAFVAGQLLWIAWCSLPRITPELARDYSDEHLE